ncbi:MAG TPA: DNA-processing protein DprA [Steroidobacteraceae bacterium]|jgi:DNA processing protein|nr:DNA-processing protein DprA [Steroidobacteraceae bacterium]
MRWSEESSAWVILSRTPGLDAGSLERALALLGGAQGIVAASEAARSGAGIPDAARRFLSTARICPAERDWLASPHHHVIPFTDPRYPSLLGTHRRRPITLYLAGDPAVLGLPQLAIVGSRNPTPQGREAARRFSRQLAQDGLVITSGLAAGIDAEAHRGALDGGGRTLAVLGAGVDVIYPRAHRDLHRDIEAGGAALSTFPLGTKPRRTHFPRRNAVIAALTLGTLVIEAAESSGSLITATMARRRGKVVLAVPGSIENPLSRGCHRLIREGAVLVQSAHDIWRELRSSLPCAAVGPAQDRSDAAAISGTGMDKNRKILLDALGFDPADLDRLVDRTGWKPEAVSSMMLILELEGHVQAAPGGRYSRVARSRGER